MPILGKSFFLPAGGVVGKRFRQHVPGVVGGGFSPASAEKPAPCFPTELGVQAYIFAEDGRMFNPAWGEGKTRKVVEMFWKDVLADTWPENRLRMYRRLFGPRFVRSRFFEAQGRVFHFGVDRDDGILMWRRLGRGGDVWRSFHGFPAV